MVYVHVMSKMWYLENTTRWRKHMKFIFDWKKYFMSERSQRVIFFLLHRNKKKKNKKEMISKSELSAREKQRNDFSDIFTSEDMENMSLVSRM